MEVANNNVSSHVSATRSRKGCLQRLPSTVATSGQLGNTQMGPSGHTANLSDFDSLSGSRLHDAEEVNHTAFRPASEPYDEQRHLLHPVDAVDAVGEAGCSNSASSDHAANSQTLMYQCMEACRSHRTMQGLLLTITRCSAMRSKTM